MRIRERLKRVSTTGVVVANLAFGLCVLTPTFAVAEGLAPIQNFHNSCEVDADCKLFNVVHCCGHASQWCFRGDAPPEAVRHVWGTMCAISWFDCERARESAPPVSCE